VLPADRVVLGLAFANAVSFVVGAVVGEVWLRARLGRLDTRRVLLTVLQTVVAGGMAALGAFLVERVLPGGMPAVSRAWLVLLVGGAVGGVAAAATLVTLRVPELNAVIRRVSGRRGR
jgi:putative peptidoglycan lipid II flippase